jgi:dipeptidyl aminopeptidase/acylaminoacyl peptidase
MLGTVLSVLVVAAVGASAGERGPSGEEGAKRPYRLDDWFDSEEFRVVTFSPDGQAVAFTRRRAMSSQTINGLEIPEVRDDIWLQTGPGKEVKNLTKGVADASGAWNPQWSADGEYLSFLSSRGGNVTVWVWARRSDSVRQVSQAGIEFRGESAGCRWLAGPKMLCLAVLEGRRAMPTRTAGRAVEYAGEMWQKVKRGELAVSPVDSLTFKPDSRRLMLFDLGGGAPREIGNVLLETFGETWWLSPDKSAVAFVRDEPSSYPLRYRYRMGYPASLDLHSLDGRPLKIAGNIPANVLMSTLRWAPDGRLAFFALGTSKINPALIYGEEFSKDVQ